MVYVMTDMKTWLCEFSCEKHVLGYQDIRNRLYFSRAIVAWSILASDRWYFYFCSVTVNWLILFNGERRVELRIPRSSLLLLRPIVHI